MAEGHCRRLTSLTLHAFRGAAPASVHVDHVGCSTDSVMICYNPVMICYNLAISSIPSHFVFRLSFISSSVVYLCTPWVDRRQPAQDGLASIEKIEKCEPSLTCFHRLICPGMLKRRYEGYCSLLFIIFSETCLACVKT